MVVSVYIQENKFFKFLLVLFPRLVGPLWLFHDVHEMISIVKEDVEGKDV